MQAAVAAPQFLRSGSQQGDGSPDRASFYVLAVAGLALLIAVAVAPARHDLEVAVTTCGALLLAGAQIWRWGAHAGR